MVVMPDPPLLFGKLDSSCTAKCGTGHLVGSTRGDGKGHGILLGVGFSEGWGFGGGYVDHYDVGAGRGDDEHVWHMRNAK